jgi:V8-like Glu-specific endopeptidase
MDLAVLRRRPRLEVLLLEERILCDAQMVPDTNPYPYRAVAKVITWWDVNHNHIQDNGEVFEATATMIGPHTALTSAHVVYDPAFGGFANQVTILPGADGFLPPFGTFHARNFVIPSEYQTAPSAGDDIAVLNFSSNIGRRTGWFGYKAYSTPVLAHSELDNIGYPGDTHSGQQQYLSSGTPDRVTPTQIRYPTSEIQVEHGSSGSPLYRYFPVNGQRIIVGVHSRRIDRGRIGESVRITPAVADFIDMAERAHRRGGVVDALNAPYPSRHTASGISAAAWSAVHVQLNAPFNNA